MSNFDETLARMKALCTYGTVNENQEKQPICTLEYTKKAADGKYYGIVKEFNSYYIKQSSEGKQSIAESYNYIGGYMNKNSYKYDSYNNALKNLELKLSSINEACEGKVNIATLDPFKKENLFVEATDKMKNEIARQRQIMYNAAMLMNESIGFNNTGVPEAPNGSNDSDKPYTNVAKANGDKDPKMSEQKPEDHSEPFGDGKAPEKGKDVKDGDVYSDGHAVAAQHPSGGKVTRVNEEISATDTDFDEGCDKGEDPASIGWDMENQTKVNEGEDVCPHCGCSKETCNCKEINEEENDWGSEGLPADSEAGVGSPDGHLMEDEESDIYIDDEESEEPEEGEEEEEVFVDDEDYSEDEDTFDDEEEPVEDEEDFEEFDENDTDALKAEIEKLEAKLAELEATVNAEEEPMEDPAEDIEAEEEPVEDEEEEIDDFEEEEEPEDDYQFESKKAKLDRIVESVVRSMLNEDELHVFGDHPGYRKEPMNLPPTGEDKNEHGEDINDDSVHNEEPFGKQIGNGKPFNDMVDAITKDVMYQLKHGVPIDNKKKVD